MNEILTIPEKAEQVKKAVIKELPRLRKLSFGFEINYYTEKGVKMPHLVVVEADYDSEFQEEESLVYKYDENDNKNINLAKIYTRGGLCQEYAREEIIGHEPNPSDICIAVNTLLSKKIGNRKSLLTNGRTFFLFVADKIIDNYLINEGEYIHEQPPKTIEFLHSIFCKKDTKK